MCLIENKIQWLKLAQSVHPTVEHCDHIPLFCLGPNPSGQLAWVSVHSWWVWPSPVCWEGNWRPCTWNSEEVDIGHLVVCAYWWGSHHDRLVKVTWPSGRLMWSLVRVMWPAGKSHMTIWWGHLIIWWGSRDYLVGVIWLSGGVMWLSGVPMWLSGGVTWLSGGDMWLSGVAIWCGYLMRITWLLVLTSEQSLQREFGERNPNGGVQFRE